MSSVERRFERYSSYNTTPDAALELFEQARESCPVAWSDELGGFFAFVDFDDVRAALDDWETFSTEPSVVRPLSDRPKGPPLEYDPPAHTGWRRLFAQAFNAKIAARVEQAVRTDAERLIDTFASRGFSNLQTEYADPLSSLTLCHIIGFDRDKIDEARERVVDALASAADPERAMLSFASFAEFGVREVNARRQAPREDFLTTLSTAELDGHPLTAEEVGSVMISLLVAGTDNTASAVGSLLYEVLSTPETRSRIQEDTNLVSAAVEEALRLHAPLFGFFRRATRPVSVKGVEIPQGSTVYLSFAAANRDAKVFKHPVDFNLDRGARAHLSFGHGIHTCVGAQTARMELRIGLSAILRRLPDVRLADGFEPTYVFGGTETAELRALPVEFTPR